MATIKIWAATYAFHFQSTATRFNNSNHAEREEKKRKIDRWVKPHIRSTDSQHSHNKTQKTLTRKFRQHTI
jgi:hypothetical protein